jgi:hypothetical protein
MVLSPPSNVCKASDASRATGADSVAAQPTQLDQLNGLQVRLPPCCQQQLPQVPIHATLVGSDCCEAEGISGRGYAPAFELCRKLVAAGFDPVSPLEAWRGETLSLRIRSIGEGARLTVADDRHGTPRLRRRQERPEGYVAGSPVAQIADEWARCRRRPIRSGRARAPACQVSPLSFVLAIRNRRRTTTELASFKMA